MLETPDNIQRYKHELSWIVRPVILVCASFLVYHFFSDWIFGIFLCFFLFFHKLRVNLTTQRMWMILEYKEQVWYQYNFGYTFGSDISKMLNGSQLAKISHASRILMIILKSIETFKKFKFKHSFRTHYIIWYETFAPSRTVKQFHITNIAITVYVLLTPPPDFSCWCSLGKELVEAE